MTEDQVERVALAMAQEIGWGTFSHFDPGDIRRLARAAIAAVGDEWRTIESAPKDGTAILVSAFRDNGLGEIYEEGGEPTVVRWIPTRKTADDGAEINWATPRGRIRSSKTFSPTHWCPLPKAPDVTEKEKLP